MNPYIHSEISVKKRGGIIEDYYEIHKLIDSTKEVCSDNRHRIFHTHWGINRIITPIIGETIINSDKKLVVVKDLCESDHILPDYKNKFIPTLSDFVNCIDERAIKNWEKKIEVMHKRYSGNKKIEELLLSPLVNTGRMKSLLLTHNSWFIHRILKMIYPVEIELTNYELSIQKIFNNMKFELWMDNGTDYPNSAKKIIRRSKSRVCKIRTRSIRKL